MVNEERSGPITYDPIPTPLIKAAIMSEDTKALLEVKRLEIRATESGKKAEHVKPANANSAIPTLGESARGRRRNPLTMRSGRVIHIRIAWILRSRTETSSRPAAIMAQKVERANDAWGSSIFRSSWR